MKFMKLNKLTSLDLNVKSVIEENKVNKLMMKIENHFE